MIHPDARLRVARLPLCRLVVTEYQPRALDRLRHYHDLLTDARYADWAPGLVSVRALGDGYYGVLDGHHRYLAHVVAGRGEVLCLVVSKDGDE